MPKIVARLFILVMVLAALLATLAALSGNWALWAVNAGIVVICGIGALVNYRMAML